MQLKQIEVFFGSKRRVRCDCSGQEKPAGGLSVRNGKAGSGCRRFEANDSGGTVVLQRRECRSGGRANLAKEIVTYRRVSGAISSCS
ncbi:hypothetical protein CEP54_011853 [Fusarium duplospermum]|uniref:Uncharacterized protein n=1 Tax=Fusarium duplospermum TaxID=1325734 RepID=A0A428PCF0_9HYPO|nr:hypothetical protein CEP54_011853 [Fusarium duplospermum]